MGRLGTDAWALACIAAGALAGGAATAAALEAREDGRAGRVEAEPCGVMVTAAPRVVVSRGEIEVRVGERAPRVHVYRSCAFSSVHELHGSRERRGDPPAVRSR